VFSIYCAVILQSILKFPLAKVVIVTNMSNSTVTFLKEEGEKALLLRIDLS